MTTSSQGKTIPNQGRVAVLLSGRGSNFAAMVRASRRAGANFSVRLVISDRPDAPGLKKAARFGIPAYYINPKQFADKAAYENEICAHLERENIELICLAGYMRLVGPVLLARYPGRIMNIHPALLPSFPGLDAAGASAALRRQGQRLHGPFRRRRDRQRAGHRPAGGGSPSRRQRRDAQPEDTAPGTPTVSAGHPPVFRRPLANQGPNRYHRIK